MKRIILPLLATLASLTITAPASAQQTLSVSNYRNSTIETFSTTTGTATLFANASNGINGPEGLTFDKAGNLYVANYGLYNASTNNYDNAYIVKFTPGGVMSTFASTGLVRPRDLAFDSNGNLYVTNYGLYNASTNNYDNPYIEKIIPGGVGTVFVSTGLNYPDGMVFDSAGNLYVANGGSYNASTGSYQGYIEKITPGGASSIFASTGLNDPYGLAFDSAGNLYAANAYDNTIEKYDSSGNGAVFANGSAGLNSPEGLAFDSGGNLYAGSFYGNTITKISPEGSASQFSNMGLNRPTHLAFAPTPEPSPTVALGIGLLGLGALVIKAKKRTA